MHQAARSRSGPSSTVSTSPQELVAFTAEEKHLSRCQTLYLRFRNLDQERGFCVQAQSGDSVDLIVC